MIVDNPELRSAQRADVAARGGATTSTSQSVHRRPYCRSSRPGRRTAARRLQQRLIRWTNVGRVPAIDDAVVEADERFIIVRGTTRVVPHRADLLLLTPDDRTSGW